MADGWPPRWLSPTTPAERKRGDGDKYAEFIETYCRIVKSSIAGPSGDLVVLRRWQRELLNGLLARRADGRYRHRRALIGIARKNGKSAWSSGVALAGLFLGPEGGEVYSCAGDRDQARIVFGTAKRMIELDPELSSIAKTYRDVIEVPDTGSIYRVLSAEAYTKEGLNPTLTVFDEVHVQPNDELWDVMALASGARIDPLMLGITTAGARTDSHGNDSLCYRMYQHGRRVASKEEADPSFFFAWWEPKLGADADHSDPKVWAEANPGLDDLVALEDFESTLKTTAEHEYRTKRTNVFTVAGGSALPFGAWDACTAPRGVTAADRPILIVDGSWNGDSTAIVGVTSDYVFTVGCWERPLDDPHWRVPIEDVKAKVRTEAKRLGARWVFFDPFRWQETMQNLENEGLPIGEFPFASPARMVPAWKHFYDAVMDRTLTHDGDPRLARHVENMRLKVDHQGARPTKEHKMSNRHIDLGVCAVAGWFIRDTEALAPSAAPWATYA